MQLFGTKGQKFHHCPRTKGQTKNLAKGRAGTGFSYFATGRTRTGRNFDILPRDVPGRDFDSLSRDIPGQKEKKNEKFTILEKKLKF